MSKGLPRSISRAPVTYTPAKKVISLKNFPITAAAAGAGVGFGTAVAGDFPAGDILFLGAACKLQFTTASTNVTNAAFTGAFSVGTDPDADGSFAGTEANIIGSTNLAAATAKVSPVTRGALATTAVFDNGNGALEINLSMNVAAADITDASSAPFTVSGYITLVYLVL